MDQTALAKKNRKKKNKSRKSSRLTAKTADKYQLYQWSVQSTEEDVKFLNRAYYELTRKKATHFREDFCGTGLLSATWIGRGEQYTAEGFDIDPEPIEWGKARHFRDLGPAAERMVFHLEDARQPSDRSPDIRCAQNFSYWVFKTRPQMLDYFKRAREDLADSGIFVIDLYGGSELYDKVKEETEISQGFTYVWDQDKFWPVTSEAVHHITFKFPDGSRMKRIFSYEWRLWGLTELKDILEDAGFSRVDCYWEGTDEDGESGNGIFTREEKGERCPSYIAYLVALK